MRHIKFSEEPIELLDTAILIKTDALRQPPLEAFYIEPLRALGVDTNRVFAMNLKYNSANKAPAVESKAYLLQLLTAVDKLGIKYLYIADSSYFKYATSAKKVESAHGYVYPCTVKGFEHIQCTYGTNYSALSYNEQLKDKLDISINTLAHLLGSKDTSVIGKDVIRHAEYPATPADVKKFLAKLHSKRQLAVDIETFSLRFYKAGLGSISFAWDKHSGGAFLIDYSTPSDSSKQIREVLKEFFLTYKGELLFFNILFDTKVLVYELFMANPSDIQGMRQGISIFDKADDAMFYAFLALNSTQDIQLGLKTLAYPFLGDWGVDVNDITQIEPQALLEYNLKDSLGTMYVQEVYYPKVVADDQLGYYTNMLKPSVGFALEMGLIGLPISPERRDLLSKEISETRSTTLRALHPNKFVVETVHNLQVKRWKAANEKLKRKMNPMGQFYEPFLPTSDQQKAELLYEVAKMPVLVTTKSGAPSSSAKVMKRLQGIVTEPDKRDLLDKLVTLSEVSTLVSTFIPAFENFEFKHETGQFAGCSFLNGNIKLASVQSGRMAGSEPNLTNLPSGSTYGEAVKRIFVPPRGWLLAGTDFAALEDKINAILTKDPAKIKIYSEGYCGHCLRSYSYYGHLMPKITSTDPKSINSIKVVYPDLRDKSKSPSFAMAYLGTWTTLVNNLGFAEAEARALEIAYHKLYAASDIYADKLQRQASKDGYITLAFGLRLRTPVLHRSVLGSSAPFAAVTEGRSVYNADSQSWGLLTNRAVIALRNELLKAPKHIQEGILFINVIHDANYQLVKEDPECIKWLNDNVIREMEWTCPQIYHPDVPMAASLELGKSWKTLSPIKNGASLEEIKEFLHVINNPKESVQD